jgi:hypothetical protein
VSGIAVRLRNSGICWQILVEAVILKFSEILFSGFRAACLTFFWN